MNLLSFLKSAIRGAWRRRVLMATPLIIMIPVALLGALLWPTKYETNTLILLQEYNGLSADVPAYVRAQDMRDKIKSLESLIRSEFILRRIVKKYGPDGADKEPTEKDLDEYRKRISVQQEGNQFVLLSLTGTKREGLGEELSAILAAVFESLLTSNNTSLNATAFLRRTRREDLSRLEERLRLSPLPSDGDTPATLQTKQLALTTTKNRIDTLTQNLDTTRAALNEQLGASPLDSALRAQPISEITTSLRSSLQTLKTDPGTKPFNTTERTSRITRLEGLLQSAETLEKSRAELETLRQTQAQIAQDIARTSALVTERQRLQTEAEGLRRRYGNANAPRINAPGVGADIQLLTAPAQIQVIDTPKDPKRPLSSKLQILFAGVFAAFATSLALGVLAEQMDGSLRSREVLSAATSLPVIAEFKSLASLDSMTSSHAPKAIRA